MTTTAIVGMPSLASTYAAGLVLAGRGYPTQALQIMAIQGMIYALVRTLQVIYPERYQGTKEAIASLTSLLR